MKQVNYSAVLFDFDGTLIESSEGIYNGLRYAFKSYDLPIPEEPILRKFIGPPLVDGFRELFSLKDDEVEKMIEKYREYYSETGWKEIKVYEGIPELLKKLKQKGILLGIASTKPQLFVKKILDYIDLTKYFTYFGGTQFGPNPGTKAELIAKGVEKLHSTKEKTLMIGDRKFDILGAKEVGVPVAAVLYGFGSMEEFKEYGADFIAQDTKDLENLLLKD